MYNIYLIIILYMIELYNADPLFGTYLVTLRNHAVGPTNKVTVIIYTVFTVCIILCILILL